MSYPPQGGYGGYGGGAPPKNNMTISVVSLVLGLSGCILFAIPGIMAVMQASKVNGLAQAGQHGAAVEAAGKARRLAIIGLVISGIAIVLAIVAVVLIIVFADDTSTTTTY
jgi:hypothetical protein